MKTTIFFFYSIFFASFLHAANIYVDSSGPNDPGSGLETDPFRRIQDAIDHAASGDEIEIRPGIYTGQGNFNLDPNGLSVIIRSVDPENPEIVANTIIDPNFAGRGFYVHKGENADCLISGLTIRNTYTHVGYNGAGVYCYKSSPVISNCAIMGGHATGSGGGIGCDYGNAAFVNCTVEDNTAEYYGGGIACRFSTSVITGCTIIGNTAGLEGGGIDLGRSDADIVNCLIVDNNAQKGGGINCYDTDIAYATNCTLAANSAGIVGGAFYGFKSGAILENSILWANTSNMGNQLGLQEEATAAVAYCDVQGGQTMVYDPNERLTWEIGNIDTDPNFVLFGLADDPNGWDFHLKSEFGRWNPDTQTWVTDLATSPCIDAGDPNSDWVNEVWPHGRRINMGVYGGTSQASKHGNPADFDMNGFVNLVDFSEFAPYWMILGDVIQDLNTNGLVESNDLILFAENWLWQKNQ